MIRTSCLFALLLLLIGAPVLAEEYAEPHFWEKVADDLEIAELDLGVLPLLSPRITLVRTSLKRYRIQVISAETYGKRKASVSFLVEKSRAVFGINANFFDERDRPLGLVVSRGKQINRLHKGGKTLTGLFQVDRRGPKILSRSDYSPGVPVEAVQSGPRLMAKGVPFKRLTSKPLRSRRSGVCIDADRRVVFFVVTSGLPGATFDEVQEVLVDSRVACVDALNFDGGGSAQMLLRKEIPGAASNFDGAAVRGSDEVPVIVGLFPKQ